MNFHFAHADAGLTNRDCFWLGVHVARHKSSDAIAELVNLPGGAAQAAYLANAWGHPVDFRPESDFMMLELSGRHRTRLADAAFQRGTELPDLVARIIAQVAQDDLWAKILDD